MQLFSMSGDEGPDVDIPAVFLYNEEGTQLLLALETHPDVEVYLGHVPLTSEQIIGELLMKDGHGNVVKPEKLRVAIRSFDAGEHVIGDNGDVTL